MVVEVTTHVQAVMRGPRQPNSPLTKPLTEGAQLAPF